MSSNMNETLGKLLGYSVSNLAKGDIGLELECEPEDPNTPLLALENSKYWNTIRDGSLRNGGLEYVLSLPVKIGVIPEALRDWDEKIKLNKIALAKNCLRTSTHIHFNIQQTTPNELLSFLVFYYLVENILIKANGEARTGNLFCLSMSDAEAIFSSLIRSLRAKDFHTYFARNADRYSALNLAAIGKFGSIEFRFIKGSSDINFIQAWIDNLWNAFQVAKKINNPEEILNMWRHNDSEYFLENFFSKDFIIYLQDEVPGWRKLMTDNFSYMLMLIEELKQSTEKITYTQPAIHSLHEDLPVGEPSVKFKQSPYTLDFKTIPNNPAVEVNNLRPVGERIVQLNDIV